MCISLISTMVYGGYCLVREAMRAAEATPFNPHLRDYLRTPRSLPPGRHGPRARGGFLPINLYRRAVDELYLSLPEQMRADGPDEVKTVVWLRWGSRRAGKSRGRERWVQTCRVTVIDRAGNLIIGETTFVGPVPYGRSSVGPRPGDREIIAYLFSLQAPTAPGERGADLVSPRGRQNGIALAPAVNRIGEKLERPENPQSQ
jgi:hypothetical protein